MTSLVLVPPALAQCDATWQAGDALAGVRGVVHAVVAWDPDGAGPTPEQLVAAGDFDFAGAGPAANVAAFDPATRTWQALGAGTDGPVHALAVLPNGELVAGGQFVLADGQQARAIASWNGRQWRELGGGCTVTGMPFYAGAIVHALAVQRDGSLLAAGSFEHAGGTAAACVARWNGASWQPLGKGIPQLAVRAALVCRSGQVVVAGDFVTAGGVAATGIARWDGSAWASLGQPGTTLVDALAELPNGDLVAGGSFVGIGSSNASYAARWDGSAWQAVGSGPGFPLRHLLAQPDGSLLACGSGGVRRFAAGAWSAELAAGLGNGVQSCRAMTTLADGSLVVGGQFAMADGAPVANVAQQRQHRWHALGDGGNGTVTAVARRDGGFVVGGAFGRIGNIAAANVAEHADGAYRTLGLGTDGAISVMLTRRDGSLVVGGAFEHAGGSPARRIARWDGLGWQRLGTGLAYGGAGAQVHALVERNDGSLLVGGLFHTAGGVAANGIARWDGVAWHAYAQGGGLGTAVQAFALEPTADGGLLLGGWFAISGAGPAAHRVARWNGSTWQALGPAFTHAVTALRELPDGSVLASGSFAGGVQRFDGTAWSPLAGGLAGTVRTLLVRGGDVLAGGAFALAPGTALQNLARWDGTSWSPLAATIDGPVRALADSDDGALLVGGSFLRVDGHTTVGLARHTSPCAASRSVLGAGCSGIGTPVADLPWLGGPWRSGLPVASDVAVALLVNGFTASRQPLAAFLPEAADDCLLHVSPEHIATAAIAGGAARATYQLPDEPKLLGTQFHHQFVLLSVGGGGLVAAHTSAAVTLTLGGF